MKLLAKLAYATKTKESITTEKLGSRDLWRIANSVLEGKSAIPPLFNGPELLYSVSDKTKILLKTFLKTLNFDDSGYTLPTFPSRINLKLRDISVTPKLKRS